MKRHLGTAVRLVIFVACVGYAFWGLEVSTLAAAFAAYDGVWLLVSVLVSLAAYAVLGLRLHLMMVERPGWRACTSASLLALGVNNLVPAKLGELAKMVYLSRRCGIALPRLIGLLFWERFADVNAVLLLALVTALALDARVALLLLPAAMVAGVWCAVAALRLWPAQVSRLVALLPGAKLRAFVAQVSESVRAGLHGRGAVAALALTTLLVWMAYAGSAVALLLGAAQLPLSLPAALLVFAVVSLGMAVPASPGSLGVFEAAMVAALGWFDVPRGEALAAGLVLHMVQLVPTTLLGVLVLVRSRMRLAGMADSLERRRNARDPGAV